MSSRATTPRSAKLVQEEFRAWRTLMEQCLIRIYGEEVGMHEAEAMMILIAEHVHLQLQSGAHRRDQ